MDRCKIIGLTGQTGAGKSTVLSCFEENGACVFNADLAVKKIYESGSACLKAVAAEFGADIINPDQGLNRKLLAQRAFSSPESTQKLNSLVHPFVTALLLRMIKEVRPKVLIVDAPQLFESDLDAVCDVVISVVADEKTRLQRITERDGIDEKQARLRLSAQLDESFFREHSDYIIENNTGLASLLKKAKEISDKII